MFYNEKVSGFGVLFVILIWLAGICGYVMNVVKFFKCDFKPSYKQEVIRGVGVVTGLGAVIGYININD